MARPSLELIHVLRKAARKLQASDTYQWGQMGSFNCGFIAQEVTKLPREEIHRRAMQGHGDWNEQLNDYCPFSGKPMDDIISELLAFGFDTVDLRHLEKLSDPEILRTFAANEVLNFNCKSDVVKYLRSWAEALETQLLMGVKLPSIKLTAAIA